MRRIILMSIVVTLVGPWSVYAQRASAQGFLIEAAKGNMQEIELGNLAVSKAEQADVKTFGQRMVTDHTKALEELKALAEKKNVQLPTEPDAKQKGEHDKMAALSGAAFDRAYTQAMLEDHRKDVAAFKRQSRASTDADVKAWAAQTLPTLQDHLREAESLNGKLSRKTQ